MKLNFKSSEHRIFVNEAFEDKVTLFVLELLNLVFRTHIVVLELALTCKVSNTAVDLCVEHVCTEIEYSAFVYLVVFILACWLLAVTFYKC